MKRATLNGVVELPGDKSISHRAAIFAGLATGKSVISNYLTAEDTERTLKVFEDLEKECIVERNNNTITVDSPGILDRARTGRYTNTQHEFDMGNSGTAMRLLAGMFCGFNGGKFTLTGDDSLNKRPMGRIVQPLTQQAGAKISAQSDGTPPLIIEGTANLKEIEYESPVASAQVKSCLLLAGFVAEQSVRLTEPTLSRNHSELFLEALNTNISHDLNKPGVTLGAPFQLKAFELNVPGDISSAAFFIVAGLIAGPGSELRIKNCGINPTRTGILDLLPGLIDQSTVTKSLGEDTADLLIQPQDFDRIEFGGDIIPRLVDEVPILAILGLFTKRGFRVYDAAELRVKESDRISIMVENLNALGVLGIEEEKKGFSFPGQDLNILRAGTKIKTEMDHRIVMSFAILDAVLPELNLQIEGKEWAATSFPNFFDILASLQGNKNKELL